MGKGRSKPEKAKKPGCTVPTSYILWQNIVCCQFSSVEKVLYFDMENSVLSISFSLYRRKEIPSAQIWDPQQRACGLTRK